MKAWEVLAIAVDGELVCRDCLKPGEETESFHDIGEHPDISVLFASDSTGDEVCGRCHHPLVE